MNKNLLIAIAVLLVLAGGYYYITLNKTSDEVTSMVDESMTDDNSMTNDESMGGNDAMMSDDSMSNDEEMMESSSMENDESMMGDNTVKVFKVHGGNFYYTPNTFTVNEGDTVKVEMTNDGGTHDWNLDEFDAHTEVSQTGETVTVTFVADKAGEYEFYCSIGNHRANGMFGTLIVQ